jgi:hypothetical protein
LTISNAKASKKLKGRVAEHFGYPISRAVELELARPEDIFDRLRRATLPIVG